MTINTDVKVTTHVRTHRIPYCNSFCTTASPFLLTGHFETSAVNDPGHHKVKNTPCDVPLVPPSPKRQSVLLLCRSFLSYMPFYNKYTKWPSTDIEHYKVMLTSYIFPQVLNLSPFCSMASRCRVTATLREVYQMIPNDLEHYHVSKILFVCPTSSPK